MSLSSQFQNNTDFFPVVAKYFRLHRPQQFTELIIAKYWCLVLYYVYILLY